MKPLSILIATGGTGGHIYPALAFADALKANDPTISITFVGSTTRMEKTIIPDHDYPFIGLDLIVPSGSMVKKTKAGLSLIKATATMDHYLNDHPCDLVVGFGNYIEMPLVQAANKHHVPIMLHEQNAILGKANKMAMKHACVLATSYPMDLIVPSTCQVVYTGNPQAGKAASLYHQPRSSQHELGFIHDEYPLVTIVMGSLGSSSINALLLQCIDSFATHDINYLIVSGKDGYDQFKSVSHHDNIIIRDYIDGITIYHASDLVVSRAGATVCAELFALHKPSILIPSPYVPNDHQSKNAKAAFDKGAALMLREEGLDAPTLDKTITTLIHDPTQLNAMANACQTLAMPNAATTMVELAMKVIQSWKN